MVTDQEVVFSTSPYPGLRSFLPNEADIFFGREEQIDELLNRLHSTRFLAVVGTSGCGKSSLVKAGMIPALGAGFLIQAGTRWCVAEMRPGEAPFDRLTTSLLSSLDWANREVSEPETGSFVRATLRRGPLGLVEVLRERGLPNGANLLLVVDQFEEIFRFQREGNADEADAFVNLLLASCAQIEFPVYVVLTMRSDFLGECALFDGLPQALNSNQFLAPRLTRKECEAVIVKPARVFGGDVEPLLVNHLLNDMGTDPDQLPLLQHALMRMWERATEANHESAFGDADGPVLKLTDYQAIGGLKDALSLHADEVYGELNEKQQAIAERMFRRLTERGVGKRDIRRPTRLGELAAVVEADVDDVKEIVEVFRRTDRSFLMPPPPIRLHEDTIIDIGHESLIRQWQRLNKWVTTEAESARLYRRLAEDALLHEQGKTGYLTDPQLQIALDWCDRNQPNQAWVNRYSEAEFSQVRSFLEASQAERERLQNEQTAREREKVEIAERIARERERAETSERLASAERVRFEEQRKATQRLRALAIALGIMSLGTIAVAAYAFSAKRMADEARHMTNAQRHIAEKQFIRADSAMRVAQVQQVRAERQRATADSLRMKVETEGNLAKKAERRARVEQEKAEIQSRKLMMALKLAEDRRIEAEQQRAAAESAKAVAEAATDTAVAAQRRVEQQRQLTVNAQREADEARISNVTYGVGAPPSDISAFFRGEVRPLRPGASVGSTATGSLGCFVIDSSGTRYLLSLGFIFDGDIGTPIYQPSIQDGGDRKKHIVAVIERKAAPINTRPEQKLTSTFDLVLARIQERVEIQNVLPHLGRIKGVASSIPLGETVYLVGRGSGLGTGKIIKFEDNGDIVTTRLSSSGDAGGPVLTKDGMLIGILWGGSAGKSLIIPIQPMLDKLNVKLIL